MSRYTVLVTDDAAGNVAYEWREAGGRIVNLLHMIEGFVVDIDPSLVGELADDERILEVEGDIPVLPDAIYTEMQEVPTTSNQRDRTSQRELPLSGTWRYRATGEGVRVYVIDSGVRRDHTLLQNVITGYHSGTSYTGTHGSGCAGVIGATNLGLAPDVTIVDCNIADEEGGMKTSGVATALNWIAANHPAGVGGVVSISLNNLNAITSVMTAMEAVLARNIAISKSAGNDGAETLGFINETSQERRGLFVGGMSVTSNDDLISSQSNWGENVSIFGPVPTDTIGTVNTTGTRTFNGTSAVAPQIAAVCALMFEMFPNISLEQMHSAIIEEATEKIIDPDSSHNSPNLLLYSPVYDHGEWMETHRLPMSTVTEVVDNTIEYDKQYRYRIVPVLNGEELMASDWIEPEERTFITEFSEYPLGEKPDDWSYGWQVNSGGPNATVATHTQASGGRRLVNDAVSSGRKFLSWDKVGVVSDVDMRVRASLSYAGTNDLRIIARGSGGEDRQFGYFLEFLGTNGERVIRLMAYSEPLGSFNTVVSAIPFEYVTGVWYQIRLRVQGDEVMAKAWLDSEPEPEDWMLSGTSTLVESPGHVGVGEWSAFPHYYDSVSVGLDGAEAPELPPPRIYNQFSSLTILGEAGIDVDLYATTSTAINIDTFATLDSSATRIRLASVGMEMFSDISASGFAERFTASIVASESTLDLDYGVVIPSGSSMTATTDLDALIYLNKPTSATMSSDATILIRSEIPLSRPDDFTVDPAPGGLIVDNFENPDASSYQIRYAIVSYFISEDGIQFISEDGEGLSMEPDWASD